MTPIRGPLARLERCALGRGELAKQWLVRLIERASLDEIRELPTERIARELPELITRHRRRDRGRRGDPFDISKEQAERAASLAGLRSAGREPRAVDIARDVAALQSVLLRALREELESDPVRYAEAVEQLVEATAGIQAEAMEAHVQSRSRELESQANTDPLTGLANLRALQRQLATLLDVRKRYQHPFASCYGHRRAQADQRLARPSGRRPGADAGGDVAAPLDPLGRHGGAHRRRRVLRAAAGAGPEERGEAGRASRTAIEEEVAAPGEPPVTVSIGVAASPEHGDEAEALIDTADRAMYRAKAAGEGIALGDPPGTQA